MTDSKLIGPCKGYPERSRCDSWQQDIPPLLGGGAMWAQQLLVGGDMRGHCSSMVDMPLVVAHLPWSPGPCTLLPALSSALQLSSGGGSVPGSLLQQVCLGLWPPKGQCGLAGFVKL